MDNYNYKKIRPFCWFILENFPFIEYDFDALTPWQMWCKLGKEMNKIIDSQNNVGSEVENLSKAFIALQDYIENLDVQEEIDNKLDEMAQDGTLAEIINEQIFNMKLKYYLMPINNSSNNPAGDCHIIITPIEKKVIMIDTGYPDSYTLIKNRLNELNITKIDYVIISHYHYDHVGNLESLKSDFDMTETIYYIPPYTAHSDIETTYPYTINQIGDNTKIVPYDNQVVSIDNIKIRFFNIGQDDYTYYESQNAYYNDYSMCFVLNFLNENMLFTGDIGNVAQKRIYSKGSIHENIDFYKVEHHGTNRNADSNFLKMINSPKVAVVSTNNYNYIVSATEYTDYGGLKLLTQAYLGRNGCKIYSTANNDNFVWESDGKSYNVINDSILAQYNTIDRCNTLSVANKFYEIYVDNSFTGNICDGTESRPYKTIQEAITNGIVENLKNIIHVKNGTYDEENLVISGFNSHVIIQGESVAGTLINNIYISGCKALCIKDCTFYGTRDNCLVIGAFSNVELNNVIVNGQNATDTERGIGVYDSNLKMMNCEVSNKGIAVVANDFSKIYSFGLSGTNNHYVYSLASYSCELYEQNTNATFSDYMFYRITGIFSGQKSIRTKQQLLSIVPTGNVFNSIFYDSTDSKPVYYAGGAWHFFDGSNVHT